MWDHLLILSACGVPRPELTKLYSIEVDRALGMLLKAEVEPRVCRQAAEWEHGGEKRRYQEDPRSVDLGTGEKGVT